MGRLRVVGGVFILAATSVLAAPSTGALGRGTASATSAGAPAPLVGTWRRMTTCTELVAALQKAGMQNWVREFVAGNAFVPGVTAPNGLSRDDPCKGAVSRAHSHFFTKSREFGSLDWKGQRVDDGRYRVVNRTTFVMFKEFPKVTFHYSINGSNITFAPVVPSGCRSFRCAWAISMAYPGKAWKRVR